MIFAGISYVEGFQKKLAEVKNYEGFYEYTFWLIFNMLNVYARTQVKCTGGRIDSVVGMPDTVYVFELKVHGSAQEALDGSPAIFRGRLSEDSTQPIHEEGQI